MQSSFQLIVLLAALCGVYCGSYGTPEYQYEGAIKGDGQQRPSIRPGRVIQAAVRSKQSIRYVNVDVPDNEYEPQIIEVNSNSIPLILHFKSASSRIRVQQSHSNAEAAPVQETRSEDQAHHLRHEVVKPIIQEVREIVKPYRRVIQEIRPVVEEIQTIVARKANDRDEQRVEGPVLDEMGGITGSVGLEPPVKGGIGGSVGGSRKGGGKRSTRYNYNYGPRLY